jgi:hypothetical protein
MAGHAGTTAAHDTAAKPKDRILQHNAAKPEAGSLRLAGNHGALQLAGSPQAALMRCGPMPCGCGPQEQARAALQRSVAVSDPADPAEVEAENVADEVMRATGEGLVPAVVTGPVLARAVVQPRDLADSISEEEIAALGDAVIPTPSADTSAETGAAGADTGSMGEGLLASRDTGSGPASGAGGPVAGVETALATARASGGSPLPGPVRDVMETRFVRPFDDVRVHDDGAAAELSRSVDALAVTTGRDIFFAAGRYQPDSAAGQRLIAHELTHVVQQGHATGPVTRLARVSNGALNCPPYNGFDRSKDLDTYNCSGLAHRTYDFKPLEDTKDLLKKGTSVSPSGICNSVGVVQHWLWEYDVHLEDADGNAGASSRDFHTVAGPTDGDPLPKAPSEVWTKNGHRKVYGPGTGPSFKPAPKDQARTNNPTDQPATDSRGRPIYKVRSNFTEQSFCLPCPSGKKP